jgi:hypothetical protein
MTDEQRRTAERFLHSMMYVEKVPNFLERIKKDGDLRIMTRTGIQGQTHQMIRNPGEVGAEKRYGVYDAEADHVIDCFIEEKTTGRLI